MEHFRKRLAARQTKLGSALCVGLDPIMEKIPETFLPDRPDWQRLYFWLVGIVDATAQFASMYKPQSAYFEGIEGGRYALQLIVVYIEMNYPDIPVFLDCKRGDIDRTQAQYCIAHFEGDGVDGMNFNPYMGRECLDSLFDPEHPERTIVGLGYTSNPGARQVQDVPLQDGRPYWQFMVESIMEWAEEKGVVDIGIVMAAAYEPVKGSGAIYSEHLSQFRDIVGNKAWALIPGVGTQGGFVEETLRAAWIQPGCLAINSSSGIIFASTGNDFAEAAGAKAKELHEQMRAVLAT